MTTHDDVTREPLIRQHALLLSLAAQTVADPQVRHRGTFGGSLAHADPAGDMLAPALALGALMVIAGPCGRRTVAAQEFFADLFTTAVQPGRRAAGLPAVAGTPVKGRVHLPVLPSLEMNGG